MNLDSVCNMIRVLFNLFDIIYELWLHVRCRLGTSNLFNVIHEFFMHAHIIQILN